MNQNITDLDDAMKSRLQEKYHMPLPGPNGRMSKLKSVMRCYDNNLTETDFKILQEELIDCSHRDLDRISSDINSLQLQQLDKATYFQEVNKLNR